MEKTGVSVGDLRERSCRCCTGMEHPLLLYGFFFHVKQKPYPCGARCAGRKEMLPSSHPRQRATTTGLEVEISHLLLGEEINLYLSQQRPCSQMETLAGLVGQDWELRTVRGASNPMQLQVVLCTPLFYRGGFGVF